MNRRDITILIIVVLLVASTVTFYLFLSAPKPMSVKISGVDHEVLFSGITPSGPSGDFFSSDSYSSGFSVNPGGTFNDTIAFYSVPSLQDFHVNNITVESPTSTSFYIEAMNTTLPLSISSNQTNASIFLVIRVPDSDFSGQVTIQVTIGP